MERVRLSQPFFPTVLWVLPTYVSADYLQNKCTNQVFFFPSSFTFVKLSSTSQLVLSSCDLQLRAGGAPHMLPRLSSQQHQLLCRTGQKAEDSNVFNYLCQQWRSFLTNSRAMYSLVKVHQPANDAILSSTAFTWGLWLIKCNLHMTGNLSQLTPSGQKDAVWVFERGFFSLLRKKRNWIKEKQRSLQGYEGMLVMVYPTGHPAQH